MELFLTEEKFYIKNKEKNMKLYQKGYEVLCCMHRLCLKRQMGFSITLSDIDNIPFLKIFKKGKVYTKEKVTGIDLNR